MVKINATKSGIKGRFIYVPVKSRYLFFRQPRGKIYVNFDKYRSNQKYDKHGRVYIPKTWFEPYKITPDTVLILEKMFCEIYF